MPLIKVFGWGLLISFLGSLPLGPLNLVTTYLSFANGAEGAILFAAGCILAELIFVRLALISMNWISQRRKLFKTLEWITLMIILALAFLSFSAAINGTAFSQVMPVNIKYPFWSGVLLSTLDPMKIPFWFLWSTFLMGNKILLPQNSYYNFYVIGIGFGSLLGFMVFIFSGIYLISTIKTHQDAVNWVVGVVLLLTVIIQFYRLIYKKDLKVRINER